MFAAKRWNPVLMVVAVLGSVAAGEEAPVGTPYAIHVDSDVAISESRTFGPDVYLQFDPGARIIVNDGQTLTINSPSHVLCPSRRRAFVLQGTGAVAFTNGGTVYPGWWGAAGDGVTDDTAAIQAAIDARGNNLTVDLGPGNFLVTNRLLIYDHTRLHGCSASLSVITWRMNPNGTNILFNPTTAKSLFVLSGDADGGGYRVGMAIRNIYCRGNTRPNDSDGLSVYAVDANGLSWGTFDCFAAEQFRYGIRCHHTMTNSFTLCQLSNCSVAAVLYDGGMSTSDVWDRCIFHYSPGGVQTRGASLGIRFTNCLFETLGHYGINLAKECYEWVVTNPYVEDVPGSATADPNGCMYRLGYDGAALPINKHLTVLGGKYTAFGAGTYGFVLDANATDGVTLRDATCIGYNYVIRTGPDVRDRSIFTSGNEYLTCHGFITGADSTNDFEGDYSPAALNAGSGYYHIAKYSRIISPVVRANVPGTGTLSLVASSVSLGNDGAAVYPAEDLVSHLGVSNLRWQDIWGGTLIAGNGAAGSGNVRIYEDSDYGGNYANLTVGALSGNRTVKLPDTAGTIAVSAAVSHSYGGGAKAWIMTASEAAASKFTVTGAGGPADAVFPAALDGRIYVVCNASGQTITFKVAGRTGHAVANGKYAIATMNAVDCVEIFEQP